MGMTNQKDNSEMFRTAPVKQALYTMAIPTIIGQLIILIYNLSDTFFIGRTGNPYMIAATSLVLPIFNICIAVSGFLGIGGGSLISRLLGAGDRAEAKKISAFTLWGGIVLSVIYVLIMFVMMNPLLRLLGASDDVFGFARTYALCVIVAGGLPTIFAGTFAHLLRSVGCSRQAGFGISMGGVVNIILDPIFMFVIFPQGNEVLGAGVATCLSNCITLAYFIAVTLRLRGNEVLSMKPTALPLRESVLSLISVGIPSFISVFLFDLSQISINRLMSSYGDIPLAAIGIVLKAERIPLNTGVGLCMGMMPIVAYNYGAGDYSRMKKVMSTARLWGLAVAGLSIVAYEIFSPQITAIFIDSAETVSIGASFLRVRCLATPLMFLCFHMIYVFQGVGHGQTSLFLAIFRQLAMYIPMLLLLRFLFGMYGLVWAQVAGDAVTVCVSYIAYHRFLKKSGIAKVPSDIQQTKISAQTGMSK